MGMNDKAASIISGIRAPVEGSMRLSATGIEWQRTDVDGFWIKPLYEDTALGEKTMLMKIDPGAYVPIHAHSGELEQIYVIEGSFYDQHATLKAGDYCCRAPDAPHLSGSEDGAILMLIYTRR